MMNLFNRVKNSKSKRSNSGYKGITKLKDSTKYQAALSVCYRDIKTDKVVSKNVWSKTCNSLKEAISAREEYINKLY